MPYNYMPYLNNFMNNRKRLMASTPFPVYGPRPQSTPYPTFNPGYDSRSVNPGFDTRPQPPGSGFQPPFQPPMNPPGERPKYPQGWELDANRPGGVRPWDMEYKKFNPNFDPTNATQFYRPINWQTYGR